MEFEFRIMSNLSQTTGQKEQQAVHIILTPDSKHSFDNETMKAIAIDYMTEIEADTEPYWVDAYDNEIHIITYRYDDEEFYNFRDDFLLMQLERDYSLKVAGLPIPTVEWKAIESGGPIAFGKTFRHTTFNMILQEIVCGFTCVSLEGLNIVLKDCHMAASIEDDTSLMPHRKELIYFELDEDGERIYPGISASELADNLQSKHLGRKFAWCRQNISLESLPLRWGIDRILSIPPLTVSDFVNEMEAKGKSCSLQYDKEDRPINIWYTDNHRKIIIDGVSLGSNYTVDAIIQKCSA